MEIRERLGKNVRRLIAAKGLSLRGFAKEYGFAFSSLSRIVSGDANISLLQLQRLATALNVSPEKLIS
jgi:transcriptional regulator with XRE-family HTH domain